MATVNESQPTPVQAETFEFSLELAGIGEITEDVENALYEAGCSDALLGMQNGLIFLDFSRKATSLLKAIMEAIKSVEHAGIAGLHVAKVRPPHMSTIEMINSFLSVRSESPSSKTSFENEFWQLLLKMQPSE